MTEVDLHQLSRNNTRAINSLIFQLLATRQALHALLAVAPDPQAVAEQFSAVYEETLASLADEPDQQYLLEAYLETGKETLEALGRSNGGL